MPLLLSEVLPEFDALAPSVNEPVGDADVVELALTVVLAVMDAVPVPLGVGEPVAVPVGDWLLVPLLLSEVLPVLLAETPGVSDAVGVADSVLLAEVVVEGVGGGVPVPLAEGVPEPLLVGVCEEVAVALQLLLPEVLAEAPAVSDGVGDAETVVLALWVEDAVPEGVPVPLGV